MSSKHAPELARLEETIQIIDEALSAEDFNEGDRDIVERSRAYFAERQDVVLRMAGQSLRATQLVS